MDKSIWDLKIGDTFRTTNGVLCQVISISEDGKGLVASYLEGDQEGQEDFVFEEEIDFRSIS